MSKEAEKYAFNTGDIVKLVDFAGYSYDGDVYSGATCIVLDPGLDGCLCVGPRLCKVDFSDELKEWVIDNPEFTSHCASNAKPHGACLKGFVVPVCFLEGTGKRVDGFVVDFKKDYGETNDAVIKFKLDSNTGHVKALCTYHDREEAVTKLSDYCGT